MKTNKWIQDAQKIIGCEVPELLYVLAKIATEDNSRGLFARKCESKILECMENVKFFLGEIRRSAQDFTLHDITHCINVIDFMGQMLTDISKLNPAEISFFIYSALLHDVGMVKLPDEDTALSDIREDHGDRSAKFIRDRIISTDNGTPFYFGEWDEIYMEYLPLICASHMQEFHIVEKLPQSYILDGMEVDISLCAILLRIADAMDLKRNRAPYQLYQFLNNRSISSEHWKKHISISNCQVNKNGVYRVDGICSDEFAHRCLFNHLDIIESEIEKVFKWKNGPHPRLRLKSHLVNRNIIADGYTIWHHSFSMDILKITNLFMGEQLYGNKKLGLREIIQNSIDACMVRDEINKNLDFKQDYTYHPEILIIFDKDNNQVIIRDNGTGMNDFIIQNFFLNIGASYYSSRGFQKNNLKYKPSGFFGIGFLAAFMLSDDVYVRTSHWKEDIEYELHFIKNDKFVTKKEKPKTFSGTEIRLNVNQFKEVFRSYSSGLLIDDESSISKNVIDFLTHIFWNLKVSQIDKGVILCSIRTESFTEYVKQYVKSDYIYEIEISDYFKDIDGIIGVDTSDFFDMMRGFINIEAVDLLDGIKEGKINISNNMIDIFPFLEKFYVYDGKTGVIRDITNKIVDKLNFTNEFIFFTTKDVIVNIEKEGGVELSDEEVKEYIESYSWSCLCTENILPFNPIDKIRFTLNKYENCMEHDDIYSIHKELSDYLGYLPSASIEVSGLNLDNLFKIDDKQTIYGEYGNYEEYSQYIWLNQARIRIYDYSRLWMVFSVFKVKDIIIRIINPHITPDSSRKFIIHSSEDILIKAICLCIYLWLYEQIKTNKNAIISREYLKQLILDNWDDSIEVILKPEKKPI